MKLRLFLLFALMVETCFGATTFTSPAYLVPGVTTFSNVNVTATTSTTDLVVSNAMAVQVLNAGTINFSGYTVATLPASPTGSPFAYCSDAITSRGVGSHVYWNGSDWKTTEHVSPASTILSYILNARTSGLNVITPISDIQLVANPVNGLQHGRVFVVAGTGALVTSSPLLTSVSGYQRYDTGSTAAGVAMCYGRAFPTLTAGDYYAVGGKYAVSALCDATDKYLCIVSGMSNLTTTNVPVTGAFFLYDMFGVSGIGITNSAASNNWIAVSCKNSTYSSVDTGLPVLTVATAPENLEVIATTTAVYFYTNKVLSVTISTAAALPTSDNLLLGRTQILKDTGTTVRRLAEFVPSYNARRAPRSW